jgi:hypothetical protein
MGSQLKCGKDNFMAFNERDDGHLASTGGAQQRARFIDLTDHLGPAFGGPKRLLLLDDQRVRRRGHVLKRRSLSGTSCAHWAGLMS